MAVVLLHRSSGSFHTSSVFFVSTEKSVTIDCFHRLLQPEGPQELSNNVELEGYDDGNDDDDRDDDVDDDENQGNDDDATLDTLAPTPEPSMAAQNSQDRVIGDVPYSSEEAIEIGEQLSNLSPDCEFLVHVGDLRDAEGSPTCKRSEYEAASELFQLSPVPDFVLLGDNDSPDCPNPRRGLMFWRTEFVAFESKHWSFPYSVSRLSGHDETFIFEAKGTVCNLLEVKFLMRTNGAVA